MRESGSYYAAYEFIASRDGTQWRYDQALTTLLPNYTRLGDQFGSSFYARCS